MALATTSEEELLEWMEKQDFPHDVVQSFKDNEMDGESLEALLASNAGPDCLKELVPKLGVRLRIYKRIKSSFVEASSQIEVTLTDHYGHRQDDDPGSATDSSYKESSVSSLSGSSTASDLEISRLRKDVATLCKEKESLQFELSNLDKEIKTVSNSPGTASKIKADKPKVHPSTSSSQDSDVPYPFLIPAFRHASETRLKRGTIDDGDRKYMVQTLATLLMTHKQRPSLKDCQIVSKSLHQKFKKLGDKSSEGAWKWFIYTRCQNINRNTRNDDDDGVSQPRKKRKVDSFLKHEYPTIPDNAEDEVSTRSNLNHLEEEWAKDPKIRDMQKVKTLFIRTHNHRRGDILSMKDTTALSIFLKYPMLKKCLFAKVEFQLIMQRPEIKEEFDEEFILWSKAVVNYCKKKCTKTTAIQKLVKDIDLESDELLIAATRCLGLLFIPTKTKEESGDIPFFMRFVPNETPASAAPEPGNGQPHVVVIAHEDYSQYYVAIERKLYFESTDLASALFYLLGSHYVLNLSYHQKLNDILRFMQEKVAGIPSAQGTKWKSQVAVTHVAGISTEYTSISKKDISESDSD